MAQFIAQSGAKVIINQAPFRDAMALKNAVVAELSKNKIDISSISSDMEVGGILSALLSIDASEVVFDKVMTCLARCTYNGEKITENTFEDASARGDYYDVVLACMKENILPFFQGLLSKLKDVGGLQSLVQK